MDVHAGVRERSRDAGHAARLVVDLGDDRLALDVAVAALVEHPAGRVVVRRGHDDVAAVADAAAADRPEVDSAAASASARIAIAPGSLCSWTTN